MNGLQKWMRGRDQARQRAFLVAIVCLALLALLAFIQVAHVHSVHTDTDHCPLCIVLHTAAPVTVAAAIMVLVQLEILAPVTEARSIRATGQRQLFIRPPPSA